MQKQSREALKKKNLERRLNAKNSNIKKNNDEISNERANFNHLQQWSVTVQVGVVRNESGGGHVFDF